jgi:hypothetical protein
MMIPGAWEPRPRTAAVVEPLGSVPQPPADNRSGTGLEPETPRAELPGWLKVSIFAGTLLVAMWLAMALFFHR